MRDKLLRLGTLALVVFFVAALPACSSSSEDDAGVPDSATEDGDGGGGDVNANRVLVFAGEMIVDDELAGASVAIATNPADQFAVAYYKELSESGLCETPIQGGDPVPMRMDAIRYSLLDGEAWTTPEEVIQIETTILPGIDLVFDGDTPLVSYLGGEEGLQVCGGTDLMIARPDGAGGWTEMTAVALSNEAPEGDDCPKGQGMCDFGDVVGLWPSMAVAPNGTIGVAYRDVHNGYTKEADESSDLEWTYAAAGATSWAHQWVDLGRGSGLFNSLKFTADNMGAVAYYNGKHGMLTFSLQGDERFTEMPQCSTTADCPEHMVCEALWCWVDLYGPASLPAKSFSLAIGLDGRFLVAYYNVDQGRLMIAHSMDGLQWTKGSVDTDGNTGRNPVILVDPVSGQPGIAYQRCSDGATACDRNDDGVRYAYFTGSYPDELTSRADWEKVVISDKGLGSDGIKLDAAVLPDGTVGIAYTYSYFDSAANEGKLLVMFRKGTWENE